MSNDNHLCVFYNHTILVSPKNLLKGLNPSMGFDISLAILVDILNHRLLYLNCVIIVLVNHNNLLWLKHFL
jgi:hypothetical protein